MSLDAIDLETPLSLDRLAAQVATKRVVFVGETHDRYDHHLNQLEIIRRLHQLDPDLAIGVEYFQQPFQPQVDDYIAGRTGEKEFLRPPNITKVGGTITVCTRRFFDSRASSGFLYVLSTCPRPWLRQ